MGNYLATMWIYRKYTECFKNKAQNSKKNINESVFINIQMSVHQRVSNKKVQRQMQAGRQTYESCTPEKIYHQNK